MAPPIAAMLLSPLIFQGWKLPVLMNNSPTVDMNTSGTNFRTDVHNWTVPMFFTPDRLISLDPQADQRDQDRDQLDFSSLTNSST